MTKHRIGILALLAALVFCGLALAGSPGSSQYGNPIDHEGAPPTAGPPPGPQGLPFTGFQAGMVLMSGLAALAAGVVLRRSASENPARPVVVPMTGGGERGPVGDEFGSLFLPRALERCEVCGKTFDPKGFRISIGARGRSFHSVECARRAQVQGAPG